MKMPSSPLVVLAEDDDAMRELLSKQLTRAGMRVVEIEDGYELRDYLQSAHEGRDVPEPDLIVSDIRMPGESGLDALLQAQPFRAPILLISGFAGPELLKMTATLKVAAILAKPFELETFISLAWKAIEAHPVNHEQKSPKNQP